MITLRKAVAADAKAIQNVHRDSVENVASAFYPPHIIKAWCENLGAPDRIVNHEAAIASGEEMVVVAETGNHIVGFGTIVPKSGELRAVYVGPDVLRNGVGTRILWALEKLALESGVKELRMDSSLAALAFYKNNGYEEVERKKHTLSTGVEMDCVVMKKTMIK